jgi:hypothetical protein
MKKAFTLLTATLLAMVLANAQTPTEIPTGKKFYIQSAMNYGKNNGGYWDVPGYPKEIQKGSNIQVYDFDEGHDRTFSMHFRDSDGYYEIKIGNTINSRIDIQGGETKNGTSVKTWTRNHRNNQMFLFHHLGNGKFKIFDKNSGKIICLKGRSNANGTNVHIWDNHNGPSVEWYLIDANTKKPFTPNAHNNKIPKPTGRVIVPNGYNMDNVVVKFYLKKYVTAPLTTKPNANGYYSFPDAEIDDEDYVGVVLAEADGLVSDHYKYHKTIAPGKIELNLTYPPKDSKLVNSQHRGNIPFAEKGKYYINIKGLVTNNRHNFFFRDLNKQTSQKSQIRELIGVSGTDAQSDKEIYDILKKTWEFYSKAKKSAMFNPSNEVKQAFNESLNRDKPHDPVSYWTTVEQFVNIYNKYGFIPIGNCSSQALAFAAFLRAAGVPANKMAIERLYYDYYQDHWAIIVEIKDRWYWFDPTYSHFNFPSFENLNSIPKNRKGFNYHIPFEIITVPGSTLDYVPYCGEDGVISNTNNAAT